MITAGTPQRAEAIVLRLTQYGESDLIVTFCTDEFGKLRGIAKGARRSRKRFANALEPFSRLRIFFTRRRPDSLALIESCTVISHFTGIRADLGKTLLASCLIDLTDQFLPEEKKNAPLFGLLNDFLLLLDAGPASEALLRFFEIRLLRLSGYDPVLDHCLACKTPVGRESSYRFTAEGGLLCATCRPADRDAVPVSLGTIMTLLMARELEIDRLGRLHLSEQCAQESRRLLAHFIRHLLGRDPKSVHVLNEIRRMGI